MDHYGNVSLPDWPLDMIFELALRVPASELNTLCAINRKFRQICEQSLFWKRKYLLDYGPPRYEPRDWRRAYRDYGELVIFEGGNFYRFPLRVKMVSRDAVIDLKGKLWWWSRSTARRDLPSLDIEDIKYDIGNPRPTFPVQSISTDTFIAREYYFMLHSPHPLISVDMGEPVAIEFPLKAHWVDSNYYYLAVIDEDGKLWLGRRGLPDQSVLSWEHIEYAPLKEAHLIDHVILGLRVDNKVVQIPLIHPYRNILGTNEIWGKMIDVLESKIAVLDDNDQVWLTTSFSEPLRPIPLESIEYISLSTAGLNSIDSEGRLWRNLQPADLICLEFIQTFFDRQLILYPNLEAEWDNIPVGPAQQLGKFDEHITWLIR